MCLFQSFFGLNFGSAADIDIILDNQDERKMAEIRDENGRKERHYLYFDGESVNGKVNLSIFSGLYFYTSLTFQDHTAANFYLFLGKCHITQKNKPPRASRHQN